jgi:nicotinate-nucleotide pyrophosphorylase (carboxylating)
VTCPAVDGRLPSYLVERAVREALAEDLGLSGDVTTDATVAWDARASAILATRQPGVIAGLAVAQTAFRLLDPEVSFEAKAREGESVVAGAVVARVAGSARALLSAERVALNFLCRMCGIATLTRRYVDAISGTSSRIVDTRKTTPGLRAFEKYAVKCGGGQNHRAGLFDAILIKDNHIAAAGGLEGALRAAQAHAGHMVKVEVEVTTLAELEQAMKHKIDAVLLDNMAPGELREAVRMVGGRIVTEASGGVTLETVRAIAGTGVNLISVGALTHSAPILDLGLDFEWLPKTQ